MVGDVAVVSLDFDLQTFLPWMGIVLTTSHHIRFSAFAISSSALSCQHLERVLVSVKLSAPLSVGKVYSNIRCL